jgi:hypothetical protein
MHVCKHCGREFDALRKWQQHVKAREKEGKCRKSVEDAKEERIKNMTATNRKKLKRQDEKWEKTKETDCEDWT